MGWYADYDETITKLKAGENLTERELKTLVYEGNEVDEIEGDSGRWTQSVQTIIEVDGVLYAVDWQRGLTECQENEFYDQPYKVKRVEKEVTTTVVTYEEI